MMNCPDCGIELELFANGDNGPADDRWTCDQCGVEFPHSRVPLPAGYVREAQAWEKMRARTQAQEEDRERLQSWNTWAKGKK